MDDAERDEWLAYFALVCQSCGNPRSVCSDPAIDWHPQESVCWATATLEWGQRRLQDKHKDFDPAARDRHTGELEMGPLEGVSLWVSQFDFESVADQTPSEGDEAVEPAPDDA